MAHLAIIILTGAQPCVLSLEMQQDHKHYESYMQQHNVLPACTPSLQSLLVLLLMLFALLLGAVWFHFSVGINMRFGAQ